ncbi:disintegrin and metalloproteinase domain-containing protein 10 [Galendromus occidentalis]|uniref:Disintegrin and metalloproteinase domain-containing protein 10 n=1 Tax=Galendromus occidentalis TaxID=34638 RepID=A0AAJ7SHF8_9ACAR|nr:disintegrin and metalloproteinase domain-containing protein 10 [Galendromus occidentalis]
MQQFEIELRERTFVIDRNYFCGAYVQYDVALVQQLLDAGHPNETIPIVISEMVKNLFQVANSVFSRSESTYLKHMRFYSRYLRRKPVREMGKNDHGKLLHCSTKGLDSLLPISVTVLKCSQLGVDEFVRRNHVDISDHFCFLVHITAVQPGRRREFLGFGNVGSVCNAHRAGPGGRALHGMAMAVNVAKLKDAAFVHELTFIHELGHVLGAEHDGLAEVIFGKTSCPVWEVDPENNIMFYKSRDQFHVHQRSFSKCSIRQMEQTLETCFDSFGAFVCGNGIVETGEECDCGFSEEQCAEDRCCNPAITSAWNSPMKPCTYKERTPATQCSVSNGPCCDGTSCRFRAQGTLCEAESPCRESSHCTGDSAQCPPPLPKPNRIRCRDDATCLNGTCKGSLCDYYNLTSCVPWLARADELCKTFCLSPGTNKCELLCKLHSGETCDRFLAPGFECADGEGTCDFRGHCFRIHRRFFFLKSVMIFLIFISMAAYFYAILKIATRIPRGNFARSRAAKKLETKVLNYVKRLQRLERNMRRETR